MVSGGIIFPFRHLSQSIADKTLTAGQVEAPVQTETLPVVHREHFCKIRGSYTSKGLRVSAVHPPGDSASRRQLPLSQSERVPASNRARKWRIPSVVKLFATSPPGDPLVDIVAALRSHSSIDVIGVGETGRETVEAIRAVSPDALVFADSLSDLARAIRISAGIPLQSSPTMVLAAERISRPLLVRSLAYGFDAVLPIDDTPEATASRIAEIVDGHHRLADETNLDSPAPGILSRILVTHDPIDREIADLVGSGLGDDEIARVTGRSIQDVRNRIEGIIDANNLSTRTHLAVMRAAQIVVPDLS